MKNTIKFLLYICNVILIGLIFMNIFTYDFEENNVEVAYVFLEKSVNSKYINYGSVSVDEPLGVIEVPEEKKQEEKSQVVEEVSPAPNLPVIKEEIPIKEEAPVREDVALERLTGTLAGYGPDCYGCTSFRTASGRYIGEGNIYYEDATYGKIRILSGDYSYPFGTIVKMTNISYYGNDSIYGVVLDRGGSIGKGKKFLFDLLFTSERDALSMGSTRNVTFEILRLGY